MVHVSSLSLEGKGPSVSEADEVETRASEGLGYLPCGGCPEEVPFFAWIEREEENKPLSAQAPHASRSIAPQLCVQSAAGGLERASAALLPA